MPNSTFRRWTADDIAKLKNMAQKEPSPRDLADRMAGRRTLRHNSAALLGRPP
jgi:hypothetical protein